MKKLGIAIGIGLGVIFVAPKLVGGVTESKYNEILDQLSENPSINIVERQFTADWFSGVSMARIKFAADLPQLENFEIVVKENISFGPVIYDEQGLSFNLARSDAFFSFDGGVVSDELVKLLNDKLSITSKITYGMDYHTSLDLDEIVKEQDGNTIRVGQASAEFIIKDEKHSIIDIAWQGLDFNGPKANVNVSGATVNLEQELISGSFYKGDALTIGGGEIAIPKVTATDPNNNEMFSISELVIAGSSDIENNLVDMQLSYGAKEINVAQQVFKNATLNLDFKKLDAEVLQELNTMVTQLSSQDPQVVAAKSQELMVVATKLLASDPEIAISDLSVETPEGKIQSDAIVSIDNTVYDPQNPMSLMAALKADAKGTGPEPFFEKFGLKPMLDMYVDQGFLVRDESDLSFKVQFEQGKLTVNGNVMPLM